MRAFIIAHKMGTFYPTWFASQMNAQEDSKSPPPPPPSRNGPEKEDANTNHYETLLVSAFASDEEIRRAYLKLALRCHPDKFGRRRHQQEEEETNDANNKERFQQISEAYRVLSNPELRRRYDDEGHGAFFSAAAASSSEKEYEHYLRRFRELVVLTPQGLDLEF